MLFQRFKKLAAPLTGHDVIASSSAYFSNQHFYRTMDNTLERVSNRLAFSIMLAALIIGSSVVIHSGIPPKWHGVPILVLAGYIFAGLMGVWLLLSILRNGKM
jgi:hypothetical protein